MEDIEHYDIPVYNFPYDVEEDDEETIQDNSELRVGQTFFLGNAKPERLFRPFCLSPSSGQRKKLKLMDSLSGLASTRGVLLRLTTPNILISAG